MKELSLNILDIAQNSVKAGADKIEIMLSEDDEQLVISISDNGCGMDEDFLKDVQNPFCTTRTTRKVGMGIPLYKLAAEQTGGRLEIKSKTIKDFPGQCGTTVTALFYKNHIDFTSLGDIVSTVVTLIQGSPSIRWRFNHKINENEICIDTDELKAVLGDVPLDNFEVICWIKEYLQEQYDKISYN